MTNTTSSSGARFKVGDSIVTGYGTALMLKNSLAAEGTSVEIEPIEAEAPAEVEITETADVPEVETVPPDVYEAAPEYDLIERQPDDRDMNAEFALTDPVADEVDEPGVPEIVASDAQQRLAAIANFRSLGIVKLRKLAAANGLKGAYTGHTVGALAVWCVDNNVAWPY